MKAKICLEVNCNELIETNQNYCPKHNRIKVVPFQSAVRHNESLYNTSRWRKLRNKILKEQKQCFKCGIEQKVMGVHHLNPAMGNEEIFFDESNLVAVCSQCHRLLTNKEIQQRKCIS